MGKRTPVLRHSHLAILTKASIIENLSSTVYLARRITTHKFTRMQVQRAKFQLTDYSLVNSKQASNIHLLHSPPPMPQKNLGPQQSPFLSEPEAVAGRQLRVLSVSRVGEWNK